MEIWILIVVLVQFLNAIVVLVDKYIVSKPGLPNPVVYAFYVNILSSTSIFVLLIGDALNPVLNSYNIALPSFRELSIPSLHLVIISLIFGFVTLQALIFLFKSLRQSDASDVIPIVTAVSAVATFSLSYFVFDARFTTYTFIAFVLLVVGTLLISHLRCSMRTVRLAIFSGVLFAVHSVLLKIIFNQENFSDGFFWTRMAGVIAALSLLSLRSVRFRVFKQSRGENVRAGAWILGNKLIASVAAILGLVAIDLGDISIVNALGGLQFVFLILFALLFGHKTPREVGENVGKREILHKVISVSFIVVGLFLLFL